MPLARGLESARSFDHLTAANVANGSATHPVSKGNGSDNGEGGPRSIHQRLGFSDTVFCGWGYCRASVDFYRQNPVRLKAEILSGLTVAIAQVPESVAFSFVAGVDPLVGLYATFFLGLITALVGGRPGMVSGAAGAMAVVAKIVMDQGGLFSEEKLIERGEIAACLGCDSIREQADDKRKEYLFLVMWAVGFLQMFLGVVGFGKLVKLIPQTVMTGFVNGLATIIFLAQLESLQKLDWRKAYNEFDLDGNNELNVAEVTAKFAQDLPDLSASDLAAEMTKVFDETDTDGNGLISLSEFSSDKEDMIHDVHDEYKEWRTLDEGPTWLMLFYIFGSMAIVHFLPKLTKIVPSSLVSIMACTIFEHAITRAAIGTETPTVRDMAPVKGGLPKFHIPDVDLDGESFGIITPTIISLSLVGIIESVLTLQLVDEILADTSDSTGRCTQECLAQGIANLFSAMFQSMGGDAMIGQSTINVKSGGIGRLSTGFASIMFFMFILLLSSVIELVPVAALTGVLFMVVIYTFDWSCIPMMLGDLKKLYETGGKGEQGWTTTDRCRLKDSFLICLVTIITVFTNLAVGVVTGVVVASLFYAWDTSTALSVSISTHGDTKYYTFEGPLFFASDREFKNHFSLATDPPNIYVDLHDVVLHDYSALAALVNIGMRYEEAGKKVTVGISGEGNLRLIKLFGKNLKHVELHTERKIAP